LVNFVVTLVVIEFYSKQEERQIRCLLVLFILVESCYEVEIYTGLYYYLVPC